jgi:hypothetical protein
MNKFFKIFFVILLLLFGGHACLAQAEPQPEDTLTSKVKRTEFSVKDGDQSSKDINDNQTDKTNNNAEPQSVKQVKSARPDMSKVRGARPPDIVRPTGSRIPNGIGKPAGAIRPGH